MEHALRAPPQHVSSVVRLRILLDGCTWLHAAQHDMLAMPADWLQRSCPLLECASTQIPLGTRLWFMRPGWSSEPVLECYRKGLSIDGHLLEMHMCWEVYNGIVAFCPDLRLPSLLRPSGNRAVVTGNHKQSVTSAFIHLLPALAAGRTELYNFETEPKSLLAEWSAFRSSEHCTSRPSPVTDMGKCINHKTKTAVDSNGRVP